MSLHKRQYKPIRGHSGIYRVLVSSNGGASWAEPVRGGRFAATAYSRQGNGDVRMKRHFPSFEEAKRFRFGGPASPVTDHAEAQARPRPGPMRLCDLFEVYAKNEMVHRAQTTQDKYRTYCPHLSFLWPLPVDSIDGRKIDEWLVWLKRPEYLATQNRTRCSYRHEVEFLRTLLGYYRETQNEKYLIPFFKRHRDNVTVREKPQLVKDLSLEQVNAFLRQIEKDTRGTEYEGLYYMAAFQYLTFSRVQDASALHFEDFDFTSMAVTINKKLVHRRIAGATPTLEPGAKANRGKTIPIHALLKTLFLEWTLKSGIRKGPLFQYRGSWFSYRQIEYRYTMALRRAGIPQTATHVLRHASLSEVLSFSGDLRLTQVFAGHSRSEITEKYAKVRDNRKRNVHDKFGELLSDSCDSFRNVSQMRATESS